MPPRKPKRPPKAVLPSRKPLSPAFLLVFLSILGLTVISLVACLFLATLDKPTQESKDLLRVLADSWKMGLASIIGLIGGKALP
jgi:hypothetical protein